MHEQKLLSLRTLLQHGARPDAADERGTTPSHILAAADCAEGVRMVRAARANLWLSDSCGHTPLQLARHGRRFSRAARAILFMDGAVDGNMAASEKSGEN